MRLISTFLVGLSVSLLVACGGGKDGDDDNNPATVDAPPPLVDAPPPASEITGIGQVCNPAMMGADCPTTTSGCLSAQGGTKGICTKLCVGPTPLGKFKTDAMSIPDPATLNPNPMTKDSTCTGAYTGTVGSSACDQFVNITPAPPLMPNTNYTFMTACSVHCGTGNACPNPLTCNATTMTCDP